RLLATGFPHFLGRISFCFYLFHIPIVGLLTLALADHVPLPYPAQTLVLLLVAASLSFALAWVTTLLIDEPLIHGLRYLTASRLPDAAGAPSPFATPAPGSVRATTPGSTD